MATAYAPAGAVRLFLRGLLGSCSDRGGRQRSVVAVNLTGGTGRRNSRLPSSPPANIGVRPAHGRQPSVPAMNVPATSPITRKSTIAAMITTAVYPIALSAGDFISTGSPR